MDSAVSEAASAKQSGRMPKVSLRTALTGLVICALIPAFLLAFFYTRRVSVERIAEIEARADQITAQISRIVDSVVLRHAGVLAALGASPDLKSGRLDSFHAHASEVAKYPDSVIVLIDKSKRMIISTAAPYGATLPPVVDTATTERAFASGKLEVSNIYLSPFRKEPVFAIVWPVPNTDYQLRMTLSGAALSRQLEKAAPPGWILGVVDRDRVVVARSRDSERWVGQSIPQPLREMGQPMFDAGRGMLKAQDFDGRQSYISYGRTSVGWTSIALINEEAIASVLRRGRELGPQGWIAVSGAAVLMATLAAIAIGRSLRRLAVAAESIGTGGKPSSFSSGIKEIDQVSSVLSRSARLRNLIEAEARRQDLLFRSVFESNPDCMILADIDRTVVRTNPAFSTTFQFSAAEFVGKSTQQLYARETDWLRIGARLDTEAQHFVSEHLSFKRRDKTTFPGVITAVKLFDDAGAFIAYLAIVRDITNDLQRDQALLEKRHLEALGRLSSGIAHDFNNMLTIVSGNLQLIGWRTADPRINEFIAEAQRATDTGARLSQRLMTFARQVPMTPKVADINVLVKSALDLMRRTTGETITVEGHLNADPSTTLVDASQIENALVNLALNARDAMPNGGRLTVETSNTQLDSNDATVSAGLTPGPYVRISVSDTGTGMSEAVRARAFEPFFTTKEPGKGTGLGLTTVHGSIAQLGGAVQLDSRPEQGTCVTILLPLHDQPARADLSRETSTADLQGDGRVVLLVEDNPGVRTTTTELLEHHGFRVIIAENGPSALTTAEREDKLDLVISDVVMPGGMSGFELESRLAKLRPHLKVLLYSGNPDTGEGTASNAGALTSQILRKPFTSHQLIDAIGRALKEDTTQTDRGPKAASDIAEGAVLASANSDEPEVVSR